MASSPCFFRSWHSSALSDFACISLSVIRTTGRMPFVRACCILKNCKSLFLVGSLSRRQMPGFTLGGLAVVQLAGLSCLSSRSLRFFSLSLQRNILSTSLASYEAFAHNIVRLVFFYEFREEIILITTTSGVWL